MTRIDSVKDPEGLTLTVTAELTAPVERVWRLWEDPRQLERWWGPPGYPATFTRHDFSVPGRSVYYMTSPEGERHYGWWSFQSIQPPTALEIEDGFGDENGEPTGDIGPGLFTVTIEPLAGQTSTRMTILSRFSSPEQYEQLTAMGMEEGMKEALGQIEGILAED